jgi:hypothetical protein
MMSGKKSVFTFLNRKGKSRTTQILVRSKPEADDLESYPQH